MSSATATATTTTAEETPLTYWCHECDMSMHLLLPITTNPTATPLCPQCHLDFLELMDPTPTAIDTSNNFLQLDSPTFRSTFFQHFNTHLDDHDALSCSSRSSSSLSSFSLLPTIRIAEGEADDSSLLPCAVCRDSFTLDEEAKRLPCRHLFHPVCILPWLSSGHDSCPLCRFPLTADNPPPELQEEEWFSDFESCFDSSSSTTHVSALPTDSR